MSGWDAVDCLDATVFRSVKGDARRKLLDVYMEKLKPIKTQYNSPHDKKPPSMESNVPEEVKDIVDEEVPF